MTTSSFRIAGSLFVRTAQWYSEPELANILGQTEWMGLTTAGARKSRENLKMC